MAATSASMGVRVLRAKTRTAAHRSPWDLGLAALLVLASAGLLLLGIGQASPLFTAFALIGGSTGAQKLRYWLRPPAVRMHWWYEHTGGMAGSSIATVTAFLVTNAHRLGLDNLSLVVWFGPGVLGTIALAAAQRRYRRRFGGVTAARSVAAQ